MAIYSLEKDLAVQKQTSENRKNRLQNDPSHRFLMAGAERLPELLGKFALQAAQYGMFGGKEELESVKRKRLFESSKENLSDREEYQRLYGSETPGPAPVSATSATPKEPLAIKPPPGMEKVLVTDPKDSAYENGKLKPGYSVELPKPAEGKSWDPESGKFVNKGQTDVFKVYKEQPIQEGGAKPSKVTPVSDDAKEYVSRKKPRVMPDTAQEQARKEVEALFPVARTDYQTDKKNRTAKIVERTKQIEIEDRKELESFNKSVDSKITRYEDTGLKLSPDERISRSEMLGENLLRSISGLPPRLQQDALDYSRGAFELRLPLSAQAFERAILESPNGGSVRDLTVSGDRSSRTYIKTPTTREVSENIEVNSLTIQRLGGVYATLEQDMAAIELQLKAEGVTPEQRKILGEQMKVVTSKMRQTQSGMRDAQNQITASLNDPRAKANPAMNTVDVPGLGKARLFSFEGKSASDLTPENKALRLADDWSTYIDKTGGIEKTRELLVDRFGINSRLIQSLSPENLRANGITQKHQIKGFIAKELAKKGIKPTEMTKPKTATEQSSLSLNRANNVLADTSIQFATVEEEAADLGLTVDELNKARNGLLPASVVDTLNEYGLRNNVSSTAGASSFKDANAKQKWLLPAQWTAMAGDKKKADFLMSTTLGYQSKKAFEAAYRLHKINQGFQK